jgi:predicted metal-dependent hydrolase
MTETITLGDIIIAVTRKNIKNTHLSVYPPDGRVTLVTPESTRLDVARAYAISKLGWIRNQQKQFHEQARETVRQYIGRETHYVWGRSYLMDIVYRDAKPEVVLDHKEMKLYLRPQSSLAKRAEVIHEWHKTILHQAIPPLIKKWESTLGVTVADYFLQRMKTKWGSCNPQSAHIRLNTELVKKPRDLLEYVIVHEMIHLKEPTHNVRFASLLSEHYPSWREARAELNDLPLGNEIWKGVI